MALVVLVAYVVSARLGFALAFAAEQVTTVWAPTGIAVAALLLLGRRVWPAVWAGALIANIGTSAPVWTAALIATGNTLEAITATWLLRRDPAFDTKLERVRDVVRLLVLAGCVATAVSATIGVATLCAAAVQPWRRFPELWSSWWLGDALGVLVIAPLVLTVARWWPGRRGFLPLAILALGYAALTQVAFGHLLGSTLGEGLLHYIVFPAVVAAAVRLGQPATSVSIAVISAVAIWNTVNGVGPFGSAGLPHGLILLQSFMAVLAGTGLLLAAAMSERVTSQRRRLVTHGVGEVLAEARDLAQAAPAILRRLGENLGWDLGALWQVDPDAKVLRCVSLWISPGTEAAAFEHRTAEIVFSPGVGLPGRVWSTGQPIWIEDVVKDSNFPRAAAADESGLHGALGFPIRLGGNVIAVAEFFTREVALPDSDLLSTMATVGNQLEQFIARKNVEADILGEQRRHRAILDSALDAVIAMDHDGKITEFNPAAERMFGHAKDHAIGRQLADLIIPPDLRQQHRDGLRRHLETGEGPFLNRRVETRGYHAAGFQFPIEVAIIRLTDDGPPRFTGFIRDLTARKRAEDAIRISEERFRTLAASNSAMTLYEQDRDLRYRWVFPQHPEFPDYNIGKTDDELLPGGEGAQLTLLKKRVLDSGVGLRDEITVTLPAGRRSYDLMIEPRRDSSGAVVGVAGVAVDITERKQTEHMLRDSEARLKEADRQKDEFLAMLAHELRNPLAPIRTGLEAVRRSGDTPEAIAHVRPMMERQIGYMVRLIDDLLDVSRITSGTIHLQRRPTSLAELITSAVEANRTAIDAAGIDLDVQLPHDSVILDVDPTRFAQVLSNLLNNAVKFTGAGGRISVRGEIVGADDNRELEISVVDTGVGIDPGQLPRVFQMFFQGDPAKSQEKGGLGIGLALAQRIVDLHGGRIEAHSAGRGTGSAFTIRMPLTTVEVELKSPRLPTARGRKTTRRVLIVDDNDDSAEALAMLVRGMGCEAVTAPDGLAGIERAEAFAPDAIFLDIGMPLLDGYETCRRLRQAPSGARAFIVALTGWGQERDKQRAIDAGFDTHLTKPADPLAIEALLTTLEPTPSTAAPD